MGWFSDLQAKWTERRLTATYMRDLDALETQVAAMPLSEVRAEARHILASPRHLRAGRWSGEPALHPELAPLLRAFFSEYQVVEIPDSEQCADVSQLEPFDFIEGYLNLGTDGEHTHLAIKPGDESIYIVADDTDEDHVSDMYATVYHWIVFIERREQRLTEYWAARGGRADNGS